jgi:hypothetical protein
MPVTNSSNTKKMSEAQKNLERIEKRIKPFVSPDKGTPKPITGKWQQAPTPVHNSEGGENDLTKQEFMRALRKVSGPNQH